MTTYHTDLDDLGTFQVEAKSPLSSTMTSVIRLVEDVTLEVAESWRKVFEEASVPPRQEVLDAEWRAW